MPSPIGHALAGLAIGGSSGVATPLPRWKWLTLSVFVALAPDLDLVPGLFVGDINRYHHGWSHSAILACVFGFGFGFVLHRRLGQAFGRSVFVGIALYSSHLVLDYFAVDTRSPFGIPLLWPLIATHFHAPHTLFLGIHHGVGGDSISTFLRELLSIKNLGTVGVEAALLSPVLLVAWWIRSLRTRRLVESPDLERVAHPAVMASDTDRNVSCPAPSD